MMVFKFIIICLIISTCQCRVPDKVYCVNQECSGPISKAKTLLSYTSGDEDLISFRGNQEAVIYMKSAGTNPDLWYAEINGQSGFVNSKFLRETKIFEKHPKFVVPFDVKNKQSLQPDKVQQAHEVFEGTTIFPNQASSPPPELNPTVTPETGHFESSTPIAEVRQDFVQNINHNNLNNIPNDISNHYEILLNQNNNDIQETSNSQEIQNESQENKVQTDSATVIPILASTTTQNPVEIIDPSSSNDQLNNIVQINQELPSQNPESLTSPQPITNDDNENLMLPANVLELPNSVQILPQSTENPNTADTNELNASMPSNLIDNVENNVQPLPDIHSESNIQRQEFYVPPPSYENIQIPPVPDVPEVPAPVQNEHTVLNDPDNGDGSNLQNVNGVPIADSPVAAPQLFDTFPPAFIDTQTVSSTTESVPNDNTPTIPASTETSYFLSTESPPVPIQNSEEFKTSHEQINDDQSNIVISMSTENSITSSEDIHSSSTVPAENPTTQAYEEVTQSTPYDSTKQEYTESYLDPSTESNEDIESTTEVPISEENTSEGFLSGVYSTLADIWPSTTEAPPPETIFNPEYMHKDEPREVESSESFSFITHIIAMYKSVVGSREESRALFATPGETCYKDEYCDGESTENKNRLLTFLVTTAVSVLLFTLGYYYIDNRRQDSRLIGTINSLQRDLLFSTKECEILKEELTSTKSKLAGIEDNSFGMDDMVLSLKEEINELKAQNERLRKSLDDNEKLLRVSENTASELQNTLGDVENTLSELLVERANTEEQIAELNGKVQAFEEELISVSRDRDNYQLKYVSAESALEETKKQKKQIEQLNKKLSDAQNTIELQKHEIVALKDVVKELKSGAPSDVDVNSLIDHTEIKAKLSKVSEEKDIYMTKFELEHKERVRLTQELAVTQESLQTTTQQATEALTRLEVLGKYFQERESELMKELTAKESLWLSKQGESTSTIEKMDILQQEAQRYKEKCDALTLELAEQESMRRTAISEIESRAHTAWLEARQAKRDAEAAKEEAAALRRKLASLHQADGAASPHRPVASPLEMVDSGMLPPPMLPLSFMPPPILPPLPRPPPLGRLPSPRPSRYDRDYAPGKRYTPLADFSPTSRDGLHSPVDFDYPPESDYIARSMESEREYDRRERDGRSTGGSTHERGSSWERDAETEYHSDSPSRRRRRRRRYTRPDSGPSSASSHTESEDSGK